ncbi:putative nucleic acid-binding protein [Stackebrandtia albiflava]|uniref:Ribonuclease VapC n=1 Tax=Stackebrandtia albiflava TaxID=406432 RepID=A0A562UQP5_9ACTN|nr:PIN domain-containing protein [Stackebrandtia albiflava]TWJ07927.1 putative nucleic acid-binding protein [Stackebrandtia albiflava]
MGTVVLDSSVLIGLLNPSDALHDSAERELRRRADQTFVIPACVFAEILVMAQRLGGSAVAVVESMVDDLAGAVQPVDRHIARIAARIHAESPAVRLPDALVLATGRALDAEILTGDKRWSGRPERITVISA